MSASAVLIAMHDTIIVNFGFQPKTIAGMNTLCCGTRAELVIDDKRGGDTRRWY